MTRILYVAGTGFSGSTLLSFLLNAHPEVATVGEATGPFRRWRDQAEYPCSCGERLADCAFWREVSAEMRRRGVDFGPNRWDLRFTLARRRAVEQLLARSLRSNRLDALRDALVLRAPRFGRRLHEVARRNEAFAESVLRVAGGSVFLDATKDPVRARFLERLTRLEVFVVHLVRDAPGYVSSFTKNKRASLDPAIRSWKRMLGHVDRLEAHLPRERFLRLRYEDLCRETEAELARVTRFVGLEPRPGPVDFRATPHHVIGNSMRMASSSEVRLDESWRERLGPAEIETVLRRTARARRRLGYA